MGHGPDLALGEASLSVKHSTVLAALSTSQDMQAASIETSRGLRASQQRAGSYSCFSLNRGAMPRRIEATLLCRLVAHVERTCRVKSRAEPDLPDSGFPIPVSRLSHMIPEGMSLLASDLSFIEPHGIKRSNERKNMPVALAVRACHPEPRAFVFRLWLWHPLIRKAAMEVFNEGAPMPGAHLVPPP